jgi:uncharacterized protein YrrD
MEFQEDARVFSADGKEMGEVNRFVVDPVSKKVTHIVIQKGFFFPEEKLVPVSWISAMQENKVQLAVGRQIVDRLPAYQKDKG